MRVQYGSTSTWWAATAAAASWSRACPPISAAAHTAAGSLCIRSVNSISTRTCSRGTASRARTPCSIVGAMPVSMGRSTPLDPGGISAVSAVICGVSRSLTWPRHCWYGARGCCVQRSSPIAFTVSASGPRVGLTWIRSRSSAVKWIRQTMTFSVAHHGESVNAPRFALLSTYSRLSQTEAYTGSSERWTAPSRSAARTSRSLAPRAG